MEFAESDRERLGLSEASLAQIRILGLLVGIHSKRVENGDPGEAVPSAAYVRATLAPEPY